MTMIPNLRAPIRASRRATRTGTRLAAALALVFSVLTPVTMGVAQAAVLAPTLSAATTPGNPTVTFTGSAPGAVAGDTYYLCYGDETVPCDSANPAATTVDPAALAAPGVTHAYAKAGTYSAALFVTEAGTTYGSTPATQVVVTLDPVAALSVTTSALVATFDGTGSAALVGDTWWACFGDTATCSAVSPDAHGTVTATDKVLPAAKHAYVAAGTYPASLTVVGPYGTDTTSQTVTVAPTDPTAVLHANATTGTGTLDVTFDGSASTSSTGDTWALCYGDKSCTQGTPDVSGTGAVVLPTTPHTYKIGNFTATLWVSNGGTTSSDTAAIAVTVAVLAADATCPLTGTTRTCDLFAKGDGVAHVAGTDVPFWGFTTLDTATPVLGGPRLVATAGETLAFTVHNQLDARAGNVAITIPSLAGAPDLAGVAVGATGGSGSFQLTKPGTYVYEAGLTAGGARQVAMGLSGILIVRPAVKTAVAAAHCAYDAAVAAVDDCLANHDPLNYFDREKTVVVNDIDPDFNKDPFAGDTSQYHPTYFFVDGVAYDPAKPLLDPSTTGFDPAKDNVGFDAVAGDTVLVRYADLGLREHSLNLVNLLQTETARDGFQVRAVQPDNTEFLNAGQAGDAFVDIPADAPNGTQYPLYDAGMHLNNGSGAGLGGMLAMFNVVVASSAAADIGPVGSAVSATPTFDPTQPAVDNSQIPPVTVTGTFTGQPSGGGATPNVTSVAWALDTVPSDPTQWLTGAAVSPPVTPATVTFTIPVAQLSSLLATEGGGAFGDHTVWLQATDSAGKVGPPIGATFTLAMRDPVVSGLSITPQVTNGSTNSAILPVASTKVAANLGVTGAATTLTVGSTAGFPGTCAAQCLLTAGVTIVGGPSQGKQLFQTFSYTSLTPTTFVGVTPLASLPPGQYQFVTGNTVSLDSVPAGYVGVTATATASIPGWVVQDSQACVIPATAATPVPADLANCAGGTGATGYVVDLPQSADATPSPITSVSGFVPPPTAKGDAANFWILVRAQEGPDTNFCQTAGTMCRWSPWVYFNPLNSSTYAPLTVVNTGPTSSNPVLAPNPNNGTLAAAGNLGLFDAFTVTSTLSSAWANISLGEVFVAPASRAVGAAPPTITQCTTSAGTSPTGCVIFGQGAEMTTTTGLWGATKSTSANAFVPLTVLQGMQDGLVRVWVHGKDAAGNWGAFSAADLTLDRTAPVINTVTRYNVGVPGPTASVTVVAHDVLTNALSTGVTKAEWFIGADPGPGNGTVAVTNPPVLAPVPNTASTVSFLITGLPRGRTVSVRVLDGAGNWSLPVTVNT